MRGLLLPGRGAVLAALLAGGLAALLAGGCTVRTDLDGSSTVTLRPPFGLPPVAGLPPPELAGNAGADALVPAPRNGPYAGVMRATFNPLGRCANPLRLSGFVVDGNEVRFGLYHGTIEPDGRLKMQFRDTWVYGQFIGAHFEGGYWAPYPACTYAISLDPA